MVSPDSKGGAHGNLRWLPWYGPAVLAALFIGLLLAFLFGTTWRVRQIMTAGVEHELANARETIANRLSGNLDYLLLLATERAGESLTQDDFEARGTNYVRDHPELINLTWVSAEFVIEHVAPRAGNEQILGLSLNLSEPARASKAAKESGQPVYTETFEAIQGSPSFEVWVPVFREGVFEGLIAGVYSCERLLPTLFSVFGDNAGSLELIVNENTVVSRLSRIQTTADIVSVVALLDESIPGLSVRLVRQRESVFSFATLLVSGLCIALVLSMGWAMWALRRDAEAIHEAQRSASVLEARFQLLAASSPLSILLCDEGVVTYANPMAHELFSAARDDGLIGRSWSELVDVAPPMEDGVDSVAGVVLGARRVRRLDGTAVDVELNTASIETGDGVLTQIVLRDLTEQHRALDERLQLDAQIQHSQKLESLGVLAGGIAHDFNNLLVGVLGYGDMTLSVMSPTSPGREYVGEIVKSAQRAAELCNQMLAYSGRGRFVIQSVNLSEVVEEMTHLLEVSISKKVLLRYRFEKEIPAVDVDVTQIRQVIMNLITNASDAIGDSKGIISVSTGSSTYDEAYLRNLVIDEKIAPGTYVFLEVSDTGCGMDKDTKQRIFEPFFTSKDTGRGLGLAAVLGIIRGHKGVLNVYTEVGKGTTMKVLLPASKAVAVSTLKPNQQNPTWQGVGTILVIDDEEVVRKMTAGLLKRGGFETLLAKSGEEGVALYHAHQDEIVGVLLDMTMPGMNGEETFAELRKLDPGVRVVLTSGYNEQDVTSSISGKGAAGFIQKPYRASVLIDTFREILSSD